MVGVLGWFMALSVTIALLVGIAAVGDAAIDDARAATAADAAALAGAAAGPAAAEDAALRNGATIITMTTQGRITTVEVRVEGARATASAERLEVLERP